MNIRKKRLTCLNKYRDIRKEYPNTPLYLQMTPEFIKSLLSLYEDAIQDINR